MSIHFKIVMMNLLRQHYKIYPLGLLLLFLMSCMSNYSTLRMANSPVSNGSRKLPPFPNAEPGKCYSKCLTSESYDIVKKFYPVYSGLIIGENSCVRKVELENQTLYKGGVREELISLDIVIDTVKCKEFNMKEIILTKFNEPLGPAEWFEILCASRVTSKMVHRFQDALTEAGFLDGYRSNILDETTKIAMIKFQIANKLDLGQLSMETLSRLNIQN